MLIGNKSDLEDRVVEESAARQLAETLGIRYFETSAKTGENVAEAVEVLLEQVSIISLFFLTILCGKIFENAGNSNFVLSVS